MDLRKDGLTSRRFFDLRPSFKSNLIAEVEILTPFSSNKGTVKTGKRLRERLRGAQGILSKAEIFAHHHEIQVKRF
jgi:hypothetical protein